jgi:lipoyl-dependent peroxiredoxin
VSFRVVRIAEASWQGSVADGGGRMKLGSGAFEGSYSLKTRVEVLERATNRKS